MECTSFFVKKGISYSQAITNMKLMKFTVLYTATMKGAKQLLRKIPFSPSGSSKKYDQAPNIFVTTAQLT